MSTQKQRVGETMQRKKALDRSILKTNHVLNAGAKNAAGRDIGHGDFTEGQWFKPSKDDDYYRVKREYIKSKQPLGQAFVDERDFQYFEKKKQQEEYQELIALGEYLIDPRVYSTQKHALKILPELKTIPDQAFAARVATETRLRTILRDCIINGKEDLEFIRKICMYDTMLPLGPLWDPAFIIIPRALKNVTPQIDRGIATAIGAFNPDNTFRSLYKYGGVPITVADKEASDKKAILRGIFNPLRYANHYKGESRARFFSDQEGQIVQVILKYEILKRLFPGITRFDQAIDFFRKKSAVDLGGGELVDDNVIDTVSKWMTEADSRSF